MADDNVNVNLNFTATNETSRITDEMIRRAQAGAQQIELAYTTRMKAIADMAKRTGVSFEEMYKKSQTASANWANFENGLLLQREANLKKAAAAQAKVGDGIDDTTEKVKKQTRAQEEGANATKKQTSAGNEAVAMLGRYAAGFFTVQTAINQSQKALSTFADNQRAMQRSTSSLRLSAEEARSAKEQFAALGKETGDTIEQINTQFQRLAPSTGLYGKAAVDEFVRVRQAAHAMGADIADVMDLRNLLAKAKVSAAELPGVFDALKTTLPPHMVAPFTQGVNQIMPELIRLKLNNKQFVLDMAAMYRAAPTADFGAFQKALTASFDPMTTLGQRMKQSKAELEAQTIDLPTYIERLRAKMDEAFKGNDEQKKVYREWLLPGGSDAVFDAVDVYKEATDKMRAEQQKQADSAGAIEKERKELFDQAKAQNDALKGSLEGLYEAFGKTGDKMIGPETKSGLTTVIDLLAKYNEGIVKLTASTLLMRPDLLISGLKALSEASGGAPGAPAIPGAPAAPAVRTAPFSSRRVPGRAKGGPVEKGKPYAVGEEGPEIVVPPEHGQVLTADQSQRYGDVLAGQQGKADTELRNYLASFRDKGRTMERIAMLDDRPGALGELGGGGGGGGRGGRGGGAGDPAGGTRTGTGARGGDGTGTGTGTSGPSAPREDVSGMDMEFDPWTGKAKETDVNKAAEEAAVRGRAALAARKPMSQSDVFSLAQKEVVDAGLVGRVPADGARYGITKGTKEEWAHFFTQLSHAESGHKPWSQNESDSGGSQGLLQVSHLDNKRYKLGVEGADTREGLHDPVIGMRTGVKLFTTQMDKWGNRIKATKSWGPINTGSFHPNAYKGPTTDTAAIPATSGPNAGVAQPGIQGADAAQTNPYGLNIGREMTPEGLMVHHTGGREKSPEQLAGVLRSRTDAAPGGLSVQFFIDRDGNIHQLTPDGRVAYHAGNLEKSEQVTGKKYGNFNLEGVEVAAKDEKDLTQKQRDAIARLSGMRAEKWGYDPKTGTWGHGELTGRKERDEGRTAQDIREGRYDAQVKEAQEAARGGRTRVAGPATGSTATTGSKLDYRPSYAGTPATTGPSFSQRARAARAAAPKALPPAPVKRMPSAPGQEERAAGKGRPAPVARAVSAEGHEDAASGKGVAPVEGKAAGGPIDAETPYMVGEAGPELITPSRSGNVTSNSNLQAMMQGMREQMERPIEPVIRPRFQHMGASSARWTRQAERSREVDNSRRAARESHTDQGFA